MNLTAVRQPEEIVTRHFGESLFVARCLIPAPEKPNVHAIDIGSGAGFPGLPIKLWAAGIHLTLIESNQKKATFLREVVRALGLTRVEVFSGRAEDYRGNPAGAVTFRAMERFDVAVPVATRLVAPGGRLALLIGAAQVSLAVNLVPGLRWEKAIPIPVSANRVLLLGVRQ